MAVYYILILLWYRFWLIGKKCSVTLFVSYNVNSSIKSSTVFAMDDDEQFRFTLNFFNIWHWGTNIREFMQKAQDDTLHLTLNFLMHTLHIFSVALASADFWLLSINAVLAFVLVAPPLSWFFILGQKYHFFSALQVKTQSSPNTLIQVQIKAQEIHRARHHGDKCVFMLNGSCSSPEQLWI